MKLKISDCLYLCSPFLSFEIKEVREEGKVRYVITHFEPFAQEGLFEALLGSGVSVEHDTSFHEYPRLSTSSIPDVDGTVHGALFAYKEFILANVVDIAPEGYVFDLILQPNGVITSDSDLVNAMFDQSMLPTNILSVYDLLTYRVPVHQAMFKLSEGYTKFVEPDFYKLFVETDLGFFERRELFGSYSIKSDALQGFVTSFFSERDL